MLKIRSNLYMSFLSAKFLYGLNCFSALYYTISNKKLIIFIEFEHFLLMCSYKQEHLVQLEEQL